MCLEDDEEGEEGEEKGRRRRLWVVMSIQRCAKCPVKSPCSGRHRAVQLPSAHLPALVPGSDHFKPSAGLLSPSHSLPSPRSLFPATLRAWRSNLTLAELARPLSPGSPAPTILCLACACPHSHRAPTTPTSGLSWEPAPVPPPAGSLPGPRAGRSPLCAPACSPHAELAPGGALT